LTLVPYLVFWGLPSVRALVFDREKLMAASRELVAGIHGKRYVAMIPIHVRFAIAYVRPTFWTYLPWLLGRFLLGFVAGTQHWFDDDGAHRLPFFRRLLAFGLLLGSVNAIVQIMSPPGPNRLALGLAASLTIVVLEQVGTLGLTGAYVATIVLLMQRRSWRRLLGVIAPVGRMPLTTYLSQSLICTFLFYGWGLGWAGRVTSARCVALALSIFAVQVAGCHFWLRSFRFGPLEWLWRALVYLQWPPMRVPDAQLAPEAVDRRSA
jgi:uncharacterized protein